MIYFDSGATTLQKPPEVAASMARAVSRLSSPGRGNYPAAQQAARTAFACREQAAELFSVEDPTQIVFTSSATHGLNIAIKSLVSPGMPVVISGYEHNAVTRPLESIGAHVRVAAAPLFYPEEVLEAFRRELEAGAKVAVCNHVSNVFGFIQPVEELAALCRDYAVPLIVDASQSAGMLPIDVGRWQPAFVAMPGHKGLYGPQGTGILIVNHPCRPLLEGGTGSQSLLQTMPEELPDRLESGTHNMPGIAGLFQGLRFVKKKTPAAILRHERQLTRRFAAGLGEIGGVVAFTAADPRQQSGLLSFYHPALDPEELAEDLALGGIALRAGLHCAPLAHATAGTARRGTLRFSPSVFNTRQEVDTLLAVLHKKFKKSWRK